MSSLLQQQKRKREDEEQERILLQVQKAGLSIEDDYEEYIPLKQRRAQARNRLLGRKEEKREEIKIEKEREEDDEDEDEDPQGEVEEAPEVRKSLLDEAAELRKVREANPESLGTVQAREEAKLMGEVNNVQVKALMTADEHAHGRQYTEAMKTGWRPPRHIRDLSVKQADTIRAKWHILCDGEDVPAPIKSFKDMRFPQAILDAMADKGITRPTPIQVQGLPVVLSGRDMIGIAFTGSGKTLTFSLPMVMLALEQEKKMPITRGEGPFGIILGPSRELQRQTYEVVDYFAKALRNSRYPELRTMLCMGGEDKRAQLAIVQSQGVHMVVATPGRLNDFLDSKKFSLNLCRYIVLDEGDRMLDLGFDEEVQKTFNKFTAQRQTLLFSATMPQKFVDFARSSLVKPVTVNVGRAGAANLDVIQEVEYVKQEAKIVYLLECLQKTAPPVLIFCERQGDVDDIHEYLLLKGVDAVSIHGGKDQEERNYAIACFKDMTKDVLVATDVAAKGLDFPDIQHVINYDMPPEIENYVHRIGRTGRCGKTGVATTFINKNVEEAALLDLKHLLIEAKQRVPPVLMALDDHENNIVASADGARGCAFCGGLGHRITECPKIDKDARKMGQNRRDMLAGTGGYGGDW
jgi:ATP-dependent RNA helicase DDX41